MSQLMLRLVPLATTFLLSSLFAAAALAQTVPSGGMMRFPDVSAESIVFVYANDLWIVDRDGGVARPLASPDGSERFPRFSPDGKSIAFTGNYEGNTDIYVIPTTGGVAQRLTWHPANEYVNDWTADGESLIFSTNGMAGLGRQVQLFTVSQKQPHPKKLPVPYGSNGAISDNGKWLAYTPHSRDNRTWKRYRGGMASDIWLYHLESNVSKQITDFEGTDSLPMWHGDSIYYISDDGEEARLNLWKFDTKTEQRTQVTKFEDFDIKWPAIGPGTDGGGEIIFSLGSELRLLDLKSGESKVVSVTIPGDRPKLRSQKVDASEFITSGDISPSGKRVTVGARGDIWTLPAKKGSPRNLTRTSGVAERDPAWSPDGRWIAYFSDESGEYELYVTQSDGRGETKQLTRGGNCYRYQPTWSPDSKQIVFTDKTGSIYLHTIDGETKLVDRDPYAEAPNVNWAHDSNWLTYSLTSDDDVGTSVVWIYDIASGERHQITDGFFEAKNPVFDRKGDFLYFSSSRAFNKPEYEDVGSSFIYGDTEVLLAVPLRADVEFPMQPESDEESWTKDDDQENESEEDNDNEESEDEEAEQEDSDDDSKEVDPLSGTWTVSLDTDQLPEEVRSSILNLTLDESGNVTGSADTPDGEAVVSEGSFDVSSGKLSLTIDAGEAGDVKLTGTVDGNSMSGIVEIQGLEIPFEADKNEDSDEGEDDSSDEAKKSEEKTKPLTIDFDGLGRRIFQLPVKQGSFSTLAVNDKNQLIYSRTGDGSAIMLFDMSADKPEQKTVVSGSSVFAINADGKKLLVFKNKSLYVISAAAGQKLSDKVVSDGMDVRIDPREEWKQIFTDAWRIERDYFYDPTMHGVDWEAVRKHYEPMLDDCTSKSDVGFVIGEMISELNVGHAYYRSSNDDRGSDDSNVGLLGCTFEIEDDRYRIGTIFEGAIWDTDARSPLRAAGIKEGDFILEVDGVSLTTQQSCYAAFEGLANRIVTLTVSDDSKISDDDKQVVIKPMKSDSELRFRHWIEQKRKFVERESDGKMGYIYVVNTGIPGQNDLFRQFYGQRAKEALIIDDRWNGGGQIPTRFIELLNRPAMNYWARRDGRDWTSPDTGHQGPKCMLINGMAGSGGDMFPALFRQAKLGKLIGMRTWGGLVGMSGNPSMIDGSAVTAPAFAYYETDGTWGIEGHGVDPDIRVIDDPAKMTDGGDPQLSAAIEHLKNELKDNAYQKPDRPDYPDRSKGVGIDDSDR